MIITRREIRKISALVLCAIFLAFSSTFGQETLKEAMHKGIGYFQEDKYDYAITEFNKALKIDPNYPEAYYYRGFISYLKGSYDQAISEFNKAIKIKPTLAAAYLSRGFAYEKEGKLDQALSDYTKTIEFYPDYAEVYSNRALVYFKKKDYDNSWADVHKAESLEAAVNPEFLEKLKKASGRKE